MKLSDIMSHAGLSAYAEIALVIFLLVFIAIVIRTFSPSRNAELQEAALLPLDDADAYRVRHERVSDELQEARHERGSNEQHAGKGERKS